MHEKPMYRIQNEINEIQELLKVCIKRFRPYLTRKLCLLIAELTENKK